MKVVFLAAGKGNRLSRNVTNKPKCLIKVNGISLIQRSVNLFKARNINDIAVVVGYKHNLIRKELKDTVKYFFNPFYSKTNSISSLWFAKDFIKNEELIILNADLFFDEEVVDIILNLKNNVTMLADTSRKKEADYKFGLKGNIIKSFGKDLHEDKTDAEYVGIANIKKKWNFKFLDRLEKLIEEEKFDMWWEDIIYSYISEKEKIYYKDIREYFWIEIDYIEDYYRLKDYGYDID